MEHLSTLQVRSYELDAYGHVNNANYLNYLEFARMLFLRETGFPYAAFRAAGHGLYVSRIDIRYLRPAFLDDNLTIATTPVAFGRVKGSLQQRVLRGQEELAQAAVDFAFVGADGRPAPMPSELRAEWPVTAGMDAAAGE